MNKKKIISYIFIIVIYYFPIHATLSCLYTHYQLKQMPKDSDNKQIDWEKLYPFTQKRAETITNSLDFIEKLNLKFKNKTSKFEEKYNKYLPFRYKLCEIQALISKLIGLKIFLELDDTIILNNKHLAQIIPTFDYPKKQINSTINFFNYLKSLDIDCSFILLPTKISKYDNQLPIGIKDYSNQIADELLNKLFENNLKYLDLRESIKEQNINHYNLFFYSDHHWKQESALWASQEIAKFIKELFKLDLNLNLLNKKNYIKINKPKYYLGSLGKKVTLTLSSKEDFSIIKPKFITNFELINPSSSDKIGDFAEVMFYESKLTDSPYSINSYYYFLGDDWPLIRINNKSKNNICNKKILIIKDSFSNTFAPFLSILFEQIDLIDLRYFNGNPKTYIDKTKTDIVLTCYNAGMIARLKAIWNFD